MCRCQQSMAWLINTMIAKHIKLAIIINTRASNNQYQYNTKTSDNRWQPQQKLQATRLPDSITNQRIFQVPKAT